MQQDIFGNVIPETISIKEASNIASVSEATVRNWIKTGYLKKYNGKIIKESFNKLLQEVIGKEKLTSRANKLKKDNHNSEELKRWVDRQLSEKKRT